MKNHERINIFKQLKKYFKNFDSVFDIGCGGLFDLFTFEDSKYKRLIGIDKEPRNRSYFRDYLDLIKEIQELNDEEIAKLSNQLFEKFNSKYSIITGDVLNHDFETNQYGMIICNKMLHFFNDKMKLELIEKFHYSLKKDGLLFIKLNHAHHPNNTNLAFVNSIDRNIYQGIKNPADIRYLIEPEEFLDSIKPNYHILNELTFTDEKTLTFVIRK